MSQFTRYLYFAVHGKLPKRNRRKLRRGPRRDPNYLAFIRTKECACGCGRWPVHAAHTGHLRGMSQKADDWTTIPLWWECHWEFDNGKRSGKLFLEDRCIDLPVLVRQLNEEYELERKAA